MKRKNVFRFLSLIFAFLFVFAFAGCEFGGEFGGDEDSNVPSTQSLAGAKVLYRPADYDFSDAVEATENYYNTLSRWILDYLYDVYIDTSFSSETVKTALLDGIDTANGETFSTVTDDNKYFLYDSMRYTIKSFETKTDITDGIEKKIIKVDFRTAWNWSLSPKLAGQEMVFYKFDAVADNAAEESVVDGINVLKYTDDDIMDDIKDYYDVVTDNSSLPTYSEYYYNTDDTHHGDKDKDTFFLSPYYNETYSLGIADVKDNFQDALEYAIYMFVLGYTMEGDANAFTFNVNQNTGEVTIGSEHKSLVTALGEAKARYKEIGSYVGLADANITQIKNFILTKVIGEQSPNTFDVNINGTTTQFNRNYTQIVSNIVDYACQKAPIGKDENGNDIYISSNYLASCVTEYKADQFFLNYTIPAGHEGAGGDDTKNEYLFYYVPAAEYQSIVLYPLAEQINNGSNPLRYLQDIWLAFEYYDNPTEKEMLDSITINVGFRYFSCDGAGSFVVNGQTSITVQKGKNTDGIMGDKAISIGYGQDPNMYQINLPEDLTINTGFNNVDAINPEKIDGAEQDAAGNYYATLTGNSNIKDYYMLNNSSSYGQYGTLNPNKFSKNNAGDDACDYMEIYFDIVKDKTATNVSYNFKVALGMFYAYSEAELNK